MGSPFLIRLRGTTDGIVDLAGNTWTNNGVTVSDTQLVTGGHAMKFNNASLSIPAGNKMIISQNEDFTFCAWFNAKTAGGGYPTILGIQPSGTYYYQMSNNPSVNAALNGTPTPYYYYAFKAYTTSTITYNFGDSVHIAVVRKDNVITMYINGQTATSVTNSDAQEFDVRPLFIGSDGVQGNSIFDGELDDVCLIRGKAVWDGDFTPPTNYLSFNNVIYLTGAEAWGMDSNGTFSQLSANWTNESDANKIALFTATDGQTPTVAELKTLTMPIKAVNYADENIQPICTVTAVPQPQTVFPKGLINLMPFFSVNSIYVTNIISGAGDIKLAVTEDLQNYKVYDTTTSDWVDINNIATDGMTPTQLANVPATGWALLTTQKMGLAYYLEKAQTSDSADTDTVVLDVMAQGEWLGQAQGTGYDYSYPSNTVLNVKLYANGDYKINYCVGEP